jgi:site-specific DNA-methyltransferase (adenine-specific)
MGKTWDASGIAYNVDMWREALRVLKPGGHLLAFSGSRTYHRMTCAIEDAGFDIRDQIMWVYGSGFPKSMNVSKAIDGHVTSGRSDSLALKQVNETRPGEATVRPTSTNGHRGIVGSADAGASVKRDTPATPEGEQWDGWGTALKPAHEPICVARKPLAKGRTVAANVLAHGTGALNIDGCRVGTETVKSHHTAMLAHGGQNARPWHAGHESTTHEHVGRWPANLIHDGSDEVRAAFPAEAGASAPVRGTEASAASVGRVTGERERVAGVFHGDSGSAARFFYCAKASTKDRNEGLEDPGPQLKRGTTLRHVENAAAAGELKGNTHPTVKPTDLMAYLCRLVTPPGGKVLDLFFGSGSTGKACMREGFEFVGIDKDEDENGQPAGYLEIATARIEYELERVEAVKLDTSPQLDMFGS